MDPLELLSGDAAAFLDKVWAAHVHVHHADPASLVGMLSLDDVDHLLTGTALRAPALRLVEDGKVLLTRRFTRSATLAGEPLTGLVDARKVLELFDDGASVVLQGLHRYWPPLTRLVRELELRLGHPCQANAYLTPPGAQGFAVHSDTHDVFVFQTHGSKQWELADGSGVRQVRLEPGVSLYLPAGTPHAARAEQTASLHVTIGVNQVTWRDLLTRLVADTLQDEAYDARLPAGYVEGPGDLAGVLEGRLEDLAARLTGTDPTVLARAQATRFLTGRTPALAGGLRDRVAMSSLSDDTMLARRPTAACVLLVEDGRLRVLLGDRQVVMPARLEEPMREVAGRTRLRPSDLSAWLDPGSRLVLARRLVREGLLRIVG